PRDPRRAEDRRAEAQGRALLLDERDLLRPGRHHGQHRHGRGHLDPPADDRGDLPVAVIVRGAVREELVKTTGLDPQHPAEGVEGRLEQRRGEPLAGQAPRDLGHGGEGDPPSEVRRQSHDERGEVERGRGALDGLLAAVGSVLPLRVRRLAAAAVVHLVVVSPAAARRRRRRRRRAYDGIDELGEEVGENRRQRLHDLRAQELCVGLQNLEAQLRLESGPDDLLEPREHAGQGLAHSRHARRHQRHEPEAQAVLEQGLGPVDLGNVRAVVQQREEHRLHVRVLDG
ncbi:hypothetical protein THAOC_16777, partial [Thalassiosira oceanica]